MFIAPVIVIGAMLLLPLVGGEGEKHWSRRPVAAGGPFRIPFVTHRF